jgi:hypothetical protein
VINISFSFTRSDEQRSSVPIWAKVVRVPEGYNAHFHGINLLLEPSNRRAKLMSNSLYSMLLRGVKMRAQIKIRALERDRDVALLYNTKFEV